MLGRRGAESPSPGQELNIEDVGGLARNLIHNCTSYINMKGDIHLPVFDPYRSALVQSKPSSFSREGLPIVIPIDDSEYKLHVSYTLKAVGYDKKGIAHLATTQHLRLELIDANSPPVRIRDKLRISGSPYRSIYIASGVIIDTSDLSNPKQTGAAVLYKVAYMQEKPHSVKTGDDLLRFRKEMLDIQPFDCLLR